MKREDDARIASSEPRSRPNYWALVAIAALLIAQWFLLTAGEARRSHTADEPNHLVRGIAFWQTGDARLSYPHPPLANALATLPLREEADRLDVTSLRGWRSKDAQRLSGSYFATDFAPARAELSIARRSIAAFAVMFAAYFAFWCWGRWGPSVAVIGLALLVGHPTILAHGGLMTTDLPAMALAFVALTQFCKYLETKGAARIATFAVAVGLLLATKHSGVPIFVIFCAIALAFAWRGMARFEGVRRWVAVRRVALHFTVVVLVSGMIINVVYRFQDTCMTVGEIDDIPEPDNWITDRLPHELIDVPEFVPDSIPVPLPYHYILGIATIRGQNQVGHAGWFAGVYSKRNPFYFGALTLMKTPVGILLLLGAAGAMVRRRELRLSTMMWVMITYSVAYLVLASFAKINIGVRHMLPIFPVLVAGAARAGAWFWARWEQDVRLKAVVALAALSAAIAGPVAYPHYLGHFNALVGGAWGGHKISMIGEDWGQDMVDVADFLKGDLRPIYYYTIWGPRPLELSERGVRVKRFRCHEVPPGDGRVVVHSTDIIRNGVRCFDWLAACERDAVINHHVEIYSCPGEEVMAPLREIAKNKERAEKAAATSIDDESDG